MARPVVRTDQADAHLFAIWRIAQMLRDYFTNRKQLVDKLMEAAAAPAGAARRICYIQGPPGFGKTAVLQMLEVFCKEQKIPSALVSGKPELTEVAILRQISDGLRKNELVLKSFAATLKKLDDLAEEEAKRGREEARAIVESATQVGVKAAVGLTPAAPLADGVSKVAGQAAKFLWSRFRPRRVVCAAMPPSGSAMTF